jgi:hypothetical protein
MKDDLLFKEQQRFKQLRIWVILLAINALFIFGSIYQIVAGNKFGDKPLSDTSLLLITTLSIMFTISFSFFRLDTKIEKDGISFRFFPLSIKFKKYSWDAISNLDVAQYNALEFGGYGLRIGVFSKTIAYTISGNFGITIILKNGHKILIGTKEPEQVVKVLEQLGILSRRQ